MPFLCHLIGQLFAPEEVEVEVMDRLAAILTAVGDDAIAVRKSFGGSDSGNDLKDAGDIGTILPGHTVSRGDVQLRHDENVGGGHGSNVAESVHQLVLKHLLRGDVSGDDLAKQAIHKQMSFRSVDLSPILYTQTERLSSIFFERRRAMTDLWQTLKQKSDAGRPIVLYGMGNGADKILAVCATYGIPVSDFFASDGFVRGHTFHGKTVLSYSAMRERYAGKAPIVLIAFASSRPEVLRLMEQVAAECETYIPDVPVVGSELFDANFYEEHCPAIEAARQLFFDEESRRVYDGILAYKLSGRMDILRATESTPETAYREILHAEYFACIADLGAYNGDSIRAIRPYAPNLRIALAMEPDRRNLCKLEAYARSLSDAGDSLQVLPIPAGAWSCDTTLRFHASGNRNAGLGDLSAPSSGPLPSTNDNPYFGKTAEVAVRTPDSMIAEARAGGVLPAGRRMDFIKYDVEGAEREALLGSRLTIEREVPALLISAYHRSADLFELPLLIHELNPSYRLYLRRMAGVPAWDINLYAVPV